jgi:hypothetical protein
LAAEAQREQRLSWPQRRRGTRGPFLAAEARRKQRLLNARFQRVTGSRRAELTAASATQRAAKHRRAAESIRPLSRMIAPKRIFGFAREGADGEFLPAATGMRTDPRALRLRGQTETLRSLRASAAEERTLCYLRASVAKERMTLRPPRLCGQKRERLWSLRASAAKREPLSYLCGSAAEERLALRPPRLCGQISLLTPGPAAPPVSPWAARP